MKNRLIKRLLSTFLCFVVIASTGIFTSPSGILAESESLPDDILPDAGPTAPVDFHGVPVSAGEVDLYWTDTAADELGFKIERAPDIGGLGPGTFVQIGIAPATVSPTPDVQYFDFMVQPVTAYWYRVRAYNAIGTGLPSNMVRILTPPSMPTISLVDPSSGFLNSGENAITVNTSSFGTQVTSVEYQYVADNPSGVFDARDIYTTWMDLTIPATIEPIPVSNTMAMPANLPAGCIAEFEIRGRVEAIGVNGVWTIGSASPFTVYESATTKFIGSRPPIVGDEVKVIAYRSAAGDGPLVAKSIRYWGPNAPIAAPSLILSFLMTGVVSSIDAPISSIGHLVTGELWTVDTGKFRVDVPYFPAYIDADAELGSFVTVRFGDMASESNIARQIFRQITTAIPPTTNVNPVFDYTSVPSNVPAGTWLYIIVDGVVSGHDIVQGTWTVGTEQIKCYETALSIVTPATVGDEVLFFCRRTLDPGPLVIDQAFNILPGPLAQPYKETAIDVHLMYNGTIQSMNNNAWAIAGPSGSPLSFAIDDPEGVARIDPMPATSFVVGNPVTVEFDHIGEVLPDDANWMPMSGGPNTWNATPNLVLPPLTANQNGRLFIRAIDATQECLVSSFAVDLLSSGTGLLRVQTDPAVPTTIYLDGIPRDDWALNWVKLPEGPYTLSFSDVYAYDTPASVTVNYYPGTTGNIQSLADPIMIYDNTVTEVIANFAPQGYLRVQTSPALPATIFLDGHPMDDWSFWTNITPGSYDISFQDVDGYDTPAPQLAVVVTAGVLTEITGTYTPNGAATYPPVAHGLLRVQTSPAVPSTIFLDGLQRDDWALNWVQLTPGPYMLSFSDVYAYDTPTSVTVNYYPGTTGNIQSLADPIMIYDGVVTEVIVNFAQMGNLRVETTPATEATIFLDGHPMDDWAFWLNILPGDYTISFQPVSGLATPPPIDVTVLAGATTHVIGDYLNGESLTNP